MNDKTLVERVIAWLDGGCSSWNVPSSDIRKMATRIEALEAALREIFIHGHSEGWRGNQMRRDVKHEDAEKSWSLYVSNGALEKTIVRKALAKRGLKIVEDV